MIPRLFIGSSTEAITVVQALEKRFEGYDVRSWTDAFGPSTLVLEILEQQLRDRDFAILVASPDDLTLSRDRLHHTMRDNVLFELGLFMGAMGRHRTFLLTPDVGTIYLPSDLGGFVSLSYSTQALTMRSQAGAIAEVEES